MPDNKPVREKTKTSLKLVEGSVLSDTRKQVYIKQLQVLQDRLDECLLEDSMDIAACRDGVNTLKEMYILESAIES